MKIFIPLIISTIISYTICACDYNSTVQVQKRRIKETDVLRQIINQETLIRVVKDVKAVVDDVSSLKRNMASTKTTVSIVQQTLQTLKRRVATKCQDNTLAQKLESLKRQMDTLSQNTTLQQTVETLKREIDFLRRDKTLQNMVKSFKRELNTQRQEDKNVLENCQSRFQKYDEQFKILHKNITDIYQYLNRTEVRTLGEGFKLTKNCRDHKLLGHTQSGVYNIYPFGNETSVSVYCDMVTDGGGWTAIQKRVSGSVSFDRMWSDYKTGFGNPSGSYWIGNDVIHQLTKRSNTSLYVSIALTNGTRLYELYNQFSVANETNNYRLFLGGPATGTLGDSMRRYHDLSGMSFSTPDRDNDGWSGGNCAAHITVRGGWWFNACTYAFLNGQWSPGSWQFPWSPTVTYGKQIKETLMMIKPN